MRMAVASAGLYANNLHLAPDRYPYQHLITHIFTGCKLFLTPNQECRTTEGKLDSVQFMCCTVLFIFQIRQYNIDKYL